MSYPLGLDEYDSSKLLDELVRRDNAVVSGRCDYCNFSPLTSPCKFPHRHRRCVAEINNEDNGDKMLGDQYSVEESDLNGCPVEDSFSM